MLKHSMAVLSFDMRGHGATRTSDDADLVSVRRLHHAEVSRAHMGLTLNLLVVVLSARACHVWWPTSSQSFTPSMSDRPRCCSSDTVSVVRSLYMSRQRRRSADAGRQLQHKQTRASSIADSRCLLSRLLQLPVAALVVVDLVEGSAVSSLEHMSSVLESRPPFFRNVEDAVHWSLMTGAMRNPQSARVSVPDQLVRCEEREAEGTMKSDDASASTVTFRWRTDLLSSQPYWSDWFSGLSSLFLSCALPKLLLLAGSDRLDTPLMIAHMQGKLQLEVLANAGHSVQEDQPRETARKLAEFVQRHKLHSMGAAWTNQAKISHTNTPNPTTAALGGSDAASSPRVADAPSSASTTALSAHPAASSSSSKPPVPRFHD
jgi:hypothetical protein